MTIAHSTSVQSDVSGEKGVFEIGEVTWFRGDEVKITSKPYIDLNAEWQNAEVIESGKKVVLATPRFKADRLARSSKDRNDHQAKVAKLY